MSSLEQTNAKEELRSIVERVERLEEEKAGLTADISEVYKEAKGRGYDVPTLKTVVRLRKLTSAERQEKDALLDTYLSNIGMT